MTGYLYCFSNPSMPGLLKVGMTDRSPTIRLSEANQTDTYRPPTPYHMEFAKKVSHSREKERILHDVLSRYTVRVNPKREFFRASVEEVRRLFDLLDGTYEEIETKSPLVDLDEVDLDQEEEPPKVPKKRRSRSKTVTRHLPAKLDVAGSSI